MGINFFSKSDSALVIDNENKCHYSWQSLVRLFENFTGVRYLVLRISFTEIRLFDFIYKKMYLAQLTKNKIINLKIAIFSSNVEIY